MRRTTLAIGLTAAVLLAGHDSQAQRGGRGGGGGGGGGARGGGGGGGARGGGPVGGGGVVGPYGGGAAPRSGGSVVGPAGGTRSAGSTGGSHTTRGGTTIDYGAAGRGGTTPGGVSAGKGVGGVQVTTPGGKSATKVGTGGAVSGPGGNSVGGKAGVGSVSGPGGTASGAYRGGVAVGPQGAAAVGGKAGTATGPGGNTVGGASRAGVAGGPYGAAAGRTTVAKGAGGTYYASRSALATTAGSVRKNFGYYGAFTPGWYARYPGAWFAAGWTAARIWSAPAWGAVSSYCSYDSEPVYWDYGENIVYSEESVSIGGTEVPAAEFAQQAADLAASGKEAKVDAKGEDFQPLGVFAMVGEGETKSTNIFQLAINKSGVIRGNYYNALTDTTEPVYGSVYKDTQRAAWSVGERKTPVYEAGLANLTKDETTMLVHYTKESSQQFTLVRIPQTEGGEPPASGK